MFVKFRYCEKATKIWSIYHVDYILYTLEETYPLNHLAKLIKLPKWSILVKLPTKFIFIEQLYSKLGYFQKNFFLGRKMFDNT